ASPNDRSKDRQFRPLRVSEQGVDDLVDRLFRDGQVAFHTILRTGPSEEQAKVLLYNRLRAAPSYRGIGARRPKAIRRIAAGLPHRSCRMRGMISRNPKFL